MTPIKDIITLIKLEVQCPIIIVCNPNSALEFHLISKFLCWSYNWSWISKYHWISLCCVHDNLLHLLEVVANLHCRNIDAWTHNLLYLGVHEVDDSLQHLVLLL